MLSSIHPLGERARKMRWGVTASAYVVGSVAGGAVLGAVLGAVGWVIHRATGGHLELEGLVLAAACVTAAAYDLHLGGLQVPTVHRQVDEDWLHRYRGWVYGLGFGFQLGLGVVTIVTTATIYLTFAAAFLVGLAGSAVAATMVGAVFGLARGAPILLVARVQGPERLRSTHRRLQAAAPLWRALAIGVPCLVALSLGGAAAAAAAAA